jgi:hypothetical protein
MFEDEAIERMVLDSFDEMCADAGIEGPWADDGPLSLALVPDPLRLGAAVDLWMRIENREETIRQGFVERTSILGSHQLEAADAPPAAAGTSGGDSAEYDEGPEPILDEIELRGRLLVDVLNVVSQQLSNRRGALELGEEIPGLDAMREAILEAVNVSFQEERVAVLWGRGSFVSGEAD